MTAKDLVLDLEHRARRGAAAWAQLVDYRMRDADVWPVPRHVHLSARKKPLLMSFEEKGLLGLIDGVDGV